MTVKIEITMTRNVYSIGTHVNNGVLEVVMSRRRRAKAMRTARIHSESVVLSDMQEIEMM